MFHKLLFHAENIDQKMPVSISIDCTDRCNLNCSFCFVKDREQKDLPLEQIIHVINSLPSLKSVELGIGETLLYPYLNELVDFCYDKGLKVGFCTNGILLKKQSMEMLSKLSWLVIGITPFIDANNIISFDWLPCKYSFICVLHEKSPSDIQARLEKFMNINTHCSNLSLRSDIVYKDVAIEERLKNITIPNMCKVYASEKFKSWQGTCYFAHLKPLLLCDGYLYPCCVKTDGLDYSHKYRIARWNEIDKYLAADVQVCCEECSKSQYQDMIYKFLNDDDIEFVM